MDAKGRVDLTTGNEILSATYCKGLKGNLVNGIVDLKDLVLEFPKITEAMALEKDKVYFLKITLPANQMTAENMEIYQEKITLWANQVFLDYGISFIPFINDERVKVEISKPTD